jgi:hypothetical protein
MLNNCCGHGVGTNGLNNNGINEEWKSHCNTTSSRDATNEAK